jgi:formate dehydrogenase iron-sulfur subunit
MEINRRALLKTIAGGTAALGAGAAAQARETKAAPPDAVGLLYDATRCIGCKACMVACKQANNLTYSSESRRSMYDDPVMLSAYNKTLVKEYRSENRFAYVKSQCMHCIDPACVGACMLGALQKREHGVVTWDAGRCIGCRYCQVACPFDVPKFEWASAFPKLVKCELCAPLLAKGQQPACAQVCPRQATIFGKYTDLLKTAHARIAAAPKRYNPKIYGEEDVGGTQVLYLSKAEVAFGELGMPALGPKPVPELQQTVQSTVYYGFLAPAALYAGLAAVLWRNRKRQDEEEKS